MLDTVRVPKQFEPIFKTAQEFVSKYFGEKKEEPSKGTIELSGERYILVRAASMSIDFFETVKNLYKDAGEEAVSVARCMLFDIAHAIGKADARNFHNKMNLKNPIEKLSAGPVHFSHSGWAFVDIFPESKPSPDESYFLIYDHPFSFESDAWDKAGKRSDFPVCVMNAGYSSGWCEESFGVTLVASEILCRAKGDEACRFIMAHPSKIEDYIKEYLGRTPELVKKVTSYEIPGFFKWKKIEEELRKAHVQKRTAELVKVNEIEESLRESEEKFRKISTAAKDSIIMLDNDGKISYWNEAAEKIFGYSKEEAIGKEYHIFLVPQRYHEAYKKGFDRFKATGQGPVIDKTLELMAIKKDGAEIPIELSVSAVNLKGKWNAIGIARDITERKKLEAQQKALMKDLEETNKELDDFTYLVSHDLKEPLRSIDAFSKFLDDDYKDRLDEEGKNYIRRIRANVGRMQALIEDLLEISRIERKSNPFGEVQLEELISEVKLRLEYALKQKNAEIIIRNKLPKVFCDPVRLAEVFVNLISNAIKFNDKTQPRVEIGCSQKGNFYEFYVKDNGPGIEKQYFDKIFEIFQRLGRREECEGTGAGLTIAKKIVEMHKGKIGVESKIGEGTTFYFTIPKERGVILGKRKLGEILIDKNMLTEAKLKEALEEQEGGC